MSSSHQRDQEILTTVRRNKWALGYIALVTTVGVGIKVYELIRG